MYEYIYESCTQPLFGQVAHVAQELYKSAGSARQLHQHTKCDNTVGDQLPPIFSNEEKAMDQILLLLNMKPDDSFPPLESLDQLRYTISDDSPSG